MNYNDNFQEYDIMQLKSIDSPASDQYMKGPIFLDRKFSQKILDNSDIIEDVDDQQKHKPQKRTIYTLHNFKVETQKKLRKSMSLGIRKLFFTNLIKKLAFRWILKSPILPKQKIIQDILRENYVEKKSQKDLVLGSDIIPVIKLSNQCLIVWNFLKFILCLVLMWWLPYKVSFQTQIDNSFEISAFLLIIFDVIIKLNVEIIHEGQIINQRGLILKEYFRQTFISDIAYIGSYMLANFFVLSHYNQIFQVFIFFMNLQKLRRILIDYQESRFIEQTMTEIINLIELLLIVFFFAHIMACLWFYVGTASHEVYQNTWITKYNLENEQNLVKYVYSIYWATASMVTVGYGDITGQNPYEILCSTILMFLSSGVFAFSINSIGITLSNFNQSRANLKRTLLLMNSYMLQNNVSGELQNKIRNYLKFYFNSKNISDQNEINQIINLLQRNLKSELLFDVQSKIVVENQYLKSHFTTEFLQTLAQNLEQVSFTPQEFIYQQNECQEHHMYFIQKGQVAYIDKHSRKQLQIFEKGESFGDIEFFTSQPREISAQSISFSQVLRIKYSQFLEIISIYEEDIQNFFNLKKQLIFRQAGKCIGCLQDNHFIWNCNKLKYIPNLEKIVKKDLFYSTQKRSKINRKFKQKFNSKFHRLMVENQLKELQNVDQNTQSDGSSVQDQQTSQFINQLPLKDQRKSIATRSRKKSEFDQQDEIADEQKKSGQFDHRKSIVKNAKGISSNNLSRLSISNQAIIQNRRSTFNQIQQTTINEENQTNNEFNFLGTTLANFDTVMEYSNFFPHNNCSTVILMFQKFQLKQKQRKLLMISSNYRFFKLIDEQQVIQSSKQRIMF